MELVNGVLIPATTSYECPWKKGVDLSLLFAAMVEIVGQTEEG